MGTWVQLGLGTAVLAAIAVLTLRLAHIPRPQAVVGASVRAAVQLAVVAAALRGVFTAPATAAAVVAVMFSVAVWTATRRLNGSVGALRAVAASCAAGSTVSIALIVGAAVLDRNVRDLVAVSGIVIGGSMTAATLTGRRLLDGMRRRDEIEAWLALGATSRQAVQEIARTAVAEALVPALDQTRTVGLVTLPGAFVGALLGGAGAVSAARFQLAVLVGLLCTQSITAVALAFQLGAPAVLPADETSLR